VDMRCKICGEVIWPYEPGTSMQEDPDTDETAIYHTRCLYAFKYGEEPPAILV
jgi:ribosomal protein L32